MALGPLLREELGRLLALGPAARGAANTRAGTRDSGRRATGTGSCARGRIGRADDTRPAAQIGARATAGTRSGTWRRARGAAQAGGETRASGRRATGTASSGGRGELLGELLALGPLLKEELGRLLALGPALGAELGADRLSSQRKASYWVRR